MGKSKELAELGQVVTKDADFANLNTALRINTVADNPLRFTATDGSVGNPTWAYTEYYNEGPDGPRSAYIGVTPSNHIAMGNGLGELFRIDDYGRVTMPYQPAFHAYMNTSTLFSNGVIALNTTNYNVGNHYNTSTGRFTAPVSGAYLFTTVVRTGTNSTRPYFAAYIRKNGASSNGQGYVEVMNSPANITLAGHFAASVVYLLNAGDYVELYKGIGDLTMDANDHFAGYLLG